MCRKIDARTCHSRRNLGLPAPLARGRPALTREGCAPGGPWGRVRGLAPPPAAAPARAQRPPRGAAILTRGLPVYTEAAVLSEKPSYIHRPTVTGKSCNTRKKGSETLAEAESGPEGTRGQARGPQAGPRAQPRRGGGATGRCQGDTRGPHLAEPGTHGQCDRDGRACSKTAGDHYLLSAIQISYFCLQEGIRIESGVR